MAAAVILDNLEWPYLRNGYLYSVHRAVVFAIAQLSCLVSLGRHKWVRLLCYFIMVLIWSYHALAGSTDVDTEQFENVDTFNDIDHAQRFELFELITKKFLGLFDVYFHVLTGRPIQKLSKVNFQATGFALDNDFRKRRIHCLSLSFSCPSLPFLFSCYLLSSFSCFSWST